MKISYFTFLIYLLFTSCKPDGVKKAKNRNSNLEKIELSSTEKEKLKKELQDLSLKPTKIVSNLKLTNGIKIKYFIHGQGSTLKDGEVAKIDYEVLLDNNTFVDGNKLLKKDWLPFIIGYGMQTPGWDIAFRALKIGDFVEIYLPSEMARGKTEIKGLIPANSNNRVRVKIIGKIKPSKEIDGTKIWLLEENKNEKNLADEKSEIDFHYMVGTASNPRYDISYKRKEPFNFKFSDFGIVKGLKKSLINAKRSDKMWVLIPPEEAYGEKGLMNLVKSNEQLFYDIFIMDVR